VQSAKSAERNASVQPYTGVYARNVAANSARSRSTAHPTVFTWNYALARSARADRSLRDSDLAAALTSVARRIETLVNSGIHYDQAVANPVQHSVIAELQKMLQEYQQTEQKHLGYVRLRDSEVLRALVFLLRMALGRTSGRPRSRAFIDFLLAQFPESNRALAGSEAAGSIIVP
jgi:hypothetical protein